jgi:hypothetical protein
MHSMAEHRRKRAGEARPFVIFLAFMCWVLAGGIGRVITDDVVVAQVAFVVAVIAVAVVEMVLRMW